METSVHKRGVTLHSGERELIRRVVACCDQEAKDKSLMLPLQKATERAQNYCKVSRNTIKRIRKEGKLTPDEKLVTPGKKRKYAEYRKVNVDSFDRRVIVDTINDFYVNKKVVPTCKKMLPVLKEIINFKWSEWALRRLLKEMGFKWKRCGSKRKILIERPDIVNWRYDYLREMKMHRDKKRKIFFLDETWIDSNLTFQKCWQSKNVDGILPDINASNRLIVVDIGSEEGFLPGGRLVYRADIVTGDYHGQMNAKNFEKWITERVLPNLPPESVIIIDNAPYHGEQVDKAPTKTSTKTVMADWLLRHGEAYDLKTTRKAVLFEAVKRLKPPCKVYKIDKLLTANGHYVVRLPPYMCDLNAIEYVWAKVKQFVRSKNSTGNMSLTVLNNLTTEALDSVTPELWKKYCNHIQNTENHYWERDGFMEDAVDDMIINLGEDSESSEDETDTEDYGDDSAEEDDNEFAQPLPPEDPV